MPRKRASPRGRGRVCGTAQEFNATSETRDFPRFFTRSDRERGTSPRERKCSLFLKQEVIEDGKREMFPWWLISVVC